MRFFLTISLFFVILAGYCQDRGLMSGKVVSRSKNLEDVYVSNLSTGDAVMTKKGGYFHIRAKEKDTLMFSGPFFIGYRYEIDDVDMNRDLLLIPLEPNGMTTQLDEIIITKFSSEAMGLVPRGVKRYSPMERYLYTATTGSGIVSVDAIVNWISGRTKMLKKAIQYEKQEVRKEKYLGIVSENTLISDYGIPSEYVLGFAYYVASDSQMIPILNAAHTSKDQVVSRTSDLALEFIELVQTKITNKQAEQELK